MYKDDESVKPKVIAYFWYDDGTEEGKIIYFPESRIPKNDEWQYHSISLKASDPKITHLKGFLLSNDTLSGDWSKHVDIENISIPDLLALSAEQLQVLDEISTKIAERLDARTKLST